MSEHRVEFRRQPLEALRLRKFDACRAQRGARAGATVLAGRPRADKSAAVMVVLKLMPGLEWRAATVQPDMRAGIRGRRAPPFGVSSPDTPFGVSGLVPVDPR
jgi:hypothetical protein